MSEKIKPVIIGKTQFNPSVIAKMSKSDFVKQYKGKIQDPEGSFEKLVKAAKK